MTFKGIEKHEMESIHHPLAFYLIKNKFFRKRTKNSHWAIKIVSDSRNISERCFRWVVNFISCFLMDPKVSSLHLNLSCQMNFLSLTIFMNTLEFSCYRWRRKSFSPSFHFLFPASYENDATEENIFKLKSRKQQERKLLTRKTFSKIIIITIALPAFLFLHPPSLSFVEQSRWKLGKPAVKSDGRQWLA